MDRREPLHGPWSVDEQAENDPLFKIAVMARIEEQRFGHAVRVRLLKGLALLLIVWWLSPQIERVAADVDPQLWYAVLLGVAGLYLSRLRWPRRRMVASRR